MGDYSRRLGGPGYNYGLEDDSRQTIKFQKSINKAFEFQAKGLDGIDIMRSENKGIKGLSAAQPLSISSLRRQTSPVQKKGQGNLHASFFKKTSSAADQSQQLSKSQMRNFAGEMNSYNSKLPDERSLVKQAGKAGVAKYVAEEFSEIFKLSSRLPEGSRMEITHAHVGINPETDEQPLEMLENEHLNTIKEYEYEPMRGSVGGGGRTFLSGSHLSPESYRKDQNLQQAANTLFNPILVFTEGEYRNQQSNLVEGGTYDKGNVNLQINSSGAQKKDEIILDSNTGRGEKAVIHEVEADQEQEVSNSQTKFQTKTVNVGLTAPARHKAEAEKRSEFKAVEEDEKNYTIPSNKKQPYTEVSGTPSANPSYGQAYSTQYNYQAKGEKLPNTNQGQYSSPQQETKATVSATISSAKNQYSYPSNGAVQVDQDGRLGPFESSAGQVFVKITHGQSTSATEKTAPQSQAQSTYQSPQREVSQFTLQNQQSQPERQIRTENQQSERNNKQIESENQNPGAKYSQSEYQKPQYEYKQYQSAYSKLQAGQKQANAEQKLQESAQNNFQAPGIENILQAGDPKPQYEIKQPKYDYKVTISQTSKPSTDSKGYQTYISKAVEPQSIQLQSENKFTQGQNAQTSSEYRQEQPKTSQTQTYKPTNYKQYTATSYQPYSKRT